MTPLLRAAGPHRPLQSLKIAQGVSGTVRDKGAVKRNVPYLVQAVKQGFQVGLCLSVIHSFIQSVGITAYRHQAQSLGVHHAHNMH